MRLKLGVGLLAFYGLLSPLRSFAQTVDVAAGPTEAIALADSTSADIATDPSTDPQNRSKAAPPTSGNVAPVTVYVFPSNGKIFDYWARNSFGGRGMAGSALRASWSTWVNEVPEEWGQGADGWSRRYGNAFLENTINQTALVLLSGAMHQDPLYYHCSCTGFWPRTKHAAKLAFVGRNHSGNAVFSPAKVISPFFGPMVTRNTIWPGRFNTGDALWSGATFFFGRIGWNMAREFFTKGEKW